MKSDSIGRRDYLDDNDKVNHPPAHVIAVLHIFKAWNTHLLQSHQLKIVYWEEDTYVNPD